MEQLGIAESRRVRGLSRSQREALMGELPPVPPPLATPSNRPPPPWPRESMAIDPEMIRAQDLAATLDASADVPAGRYRARISGRGFTEVGHAGAEGDDSYRMRLWPRSRREDPALRKRWPGWDKYR